jgi:hypothetical protein
VGLDKVVLVYLLFRRNSGFFWVKALFIPVKYFSTHFQLDSLEYVPESAQREISDLKDQNRSLCEVIKQMREEMERLGAEIPPDVGKNKSPRKSVQLSGRKNLMI